MHDNQLTYVVLLQSNGCVQELMHKMALNLCGWQQYILVTMLSYVSVNLEYVQIFQCWPVMIPPWSASWDKQSAAAAGTLLFTLQLHVYLYVMLKSKDITSMKGSVLILLSMLSFVSVKELGGGYTLYSEGTAPLLMSEEMDTQL